MFLASHFVSGGLLWEMVKRKPWYFRFPLFITGAAILHWLLDSTPVYHDMSLPITPIKALIGIYNIVIVGLFLWQLEKPKPWSKWLKKRFLVRLAVGLTAWLIWDGFWLYRPWGNYLHGIFPNIYRWNFDPLRGFALEAIFMLVVVLLSWDRLVKERHG